MRKASRIPQTDRERKKRLWLDPVIADLDTVAALDTAAQYHVSRRLVAQIAGLIVNLPSFVDVGYVYGSHAGLARFIKNENGRPTSARQVRRGIEFLTARGHLRVDRRRGTSNRMFPLYRPAESEDIMSRGCGHDVQGVRTSCPPNPIDKPKSETCTPCGPPLGESGKIVRLGKKAAASADGGSDQHASKRRPIEGQEVIQHRLAERLGSGDIAVGWEILLKLPLSHLDQITAMYRAGKLSDDEIAKARAVAEV